MKKSDTLVRTKNNDNGQTQPALIDYKVMISSSRVAHNGCIAGYTKNRMQVE